MPRFDKEALILRFKQWAYTCLDVLKDLESNNESRVVSYQMAKSSTSSYQNYRAACRAKSKADLINKLKIVEEETDETIGWLEIINDRTAIDCKLEIQEGEELLSIIVSSIKTLKQK